MTDSPDDATGDDGPDYRQLSVVALAALAIALAAFLAPAGGGIANPDVDPTLDPEGNPNVEPNAEPNAEPEPSEVDPEVDDPDGVPDIDVSWDELLEWFEFDRSDSDAPAPEPRPEPGGDRPSRSACTVWLEEDPTPGSEVTARVLYEGEPVVGAEVWYDDEFVGRTDEDGEVTGEVPYVEELVVRIETDDRSACTAVEDTASATASGAGVGTASGSIAAGMSATTAAAGTSATLTTAPAAVAGVSASSDAALARTQQAEETENGTVEYAVEGDVEIALRGRPDPGETVTVVAAIEGVPMANATVTIDGETVAETDANGTADIEVPDDGAETFELGVARGDFSGTTTVAVRLLEVSLTPEGLAPIPGSPGVLEATVGDEPVADAEVRVGDEVVGTTDADGRLGLALPVDPTTAITVSTGDRTETVSLAGRYGSVAIALGVAVVGLAAVAYRTHGARGSAAVLGATAATLLVLVVEAFHGRVAGALTALGLAALVLGVGYVRSDRGLPDGRPNAGDAVASALEWIVARLLALVALLERGVDRARERLAAARAWTSSLPRSATALAAAFGRWLTGLPARGFEALRRVPRTALAAALVAAAAIGGGYVLDGQRGAAIVAAALAVAGVLYWRRDDEPAPDRNDGDAEDADDEEPADTPVDPEETTPEPDERLTFRELWRAFARRVAPRRWRTNTPGEIRRSALEQGYPDRPVDELTTLFREVEYGRRPLSGGVRDRADAAYAALLETEADETGDAADSDASSESAGDRGEASDGVDASADGADARVRSDRSDDGTGSGDVPATDRERGGDGS